MVPLAIVSGPIDRTPGTPGSDKNPSQPFRIKLLNARLPSVNTVIVKEVDQVWSISFPTINMSETENATESGIEHFCDTSK